MSAPAPHDELDVSVRARERATLLAAVDRVKVKGPADSTVTEVIADPSGALWYDRLYGALERLYGRDLGARNVARIITGIAAEYVKRLDTGMLGKSTRDGLLEGELWLDGSIHQSPRRLRLQFTEIGAVYQYVGENRFFIVSARLL